MQLLLSLLCLYTWRKSYNRADWLYREFMVTLNYLSTAWLPSIWLANLLSHSFITISDFAHSGFYFQPLPVVVPGCYCIQNKAAITQNTPSCFCAHHLFFPFKCNSCLCNMTSVSRPVFWPSSSFRKLTATDNPPLSLEYPDFPSARCCSLACKHV